MNTGISGKLSDLKLVDLLILLCSKKEQSGKVIFEQQNETAEIYIEKGFIIHGKTELHEGINALFTLLTWDEGNFNFEPHVKPDKKTIEANTKKLLENCIQKRRELSVIKELILNRDEIFKLSGKDTSEKIKLSKTDNSIIPFIDGKSNITKIETDSRINRFAILKSLFRLLSFEVIVKLKKVKKRKIKKIKK